MNDIRLCTTLACLTSTVALVACPGDEPQRAATAATGGGPASSASSTSATGGSGEGGSSAGGAAGGGALGPEVIAFVSDRDGNREIYLMNPDGTHATRLTITPEEEAFPRLSNDGTTIAFERMTGDDWDIWTMSADGAGEVNITSSPATPDRRPWWSPDDQRLAFARVASGGFSQLFLMAANGSGVQQLTLDTTSTSFEPSWSLAGDIVYTSTRTGNYDVWIKSSADTLEGINLTDASMEDDLQPSVSPDGSKIAFASFRDGPTREIYVVGVTGLNLTRLTDDSVDQRTPVWSPDGQFILYEHYDGGTQWDIYKMSAVDGTGKVNLTESHPASDELYPFWGNYQP